MGTKLFVGGLSWDTTDQSLAEQFSPFGRVLNAKVVTDRESGRSRGFAFVEFTTPEEADAARAALHGSELDGRRIRIESSEERRGPEHRHPPRGYSDHGHMTQSFQPHHQPQSEPPAGGGEDWSDPAAVAEKGPDSSYHGDRTTFMDDAANRRRSRNRKRDGGKKEWEGADTRERGSRRSRDHYDNESDW